MVPKMVPSDTARTRGVSRSIRAVAELEDTALSHTSRTRSSRPASLEQSVAVSTLVEELAGIRRHDLPGGDAALRAGQNGLEHCIHDDSEVAASILCSSPLFISLSRSSAPPIRTPL